MPNIWVEARVSAIRDLAGNIREFHLAPAQPLPCGAPGSHIPLRLATPQGDIMRSYSLLDGGNGIPYRIAVKAVAASKGGSAALWQLQPGDLLHVGAPQNDFPLNPCDGLTLLIAGGIGITPLVSMLRALAGTNRPFDMIYAVRARQDLALHQEIARLAGDRLTVMVSDEGARIDLQAVFARLAPRDEAYVCGPLGMMAAAQSAWAALERPPPACGSRPSAPPHTQPTGASTSGFPVSAGQSQSLRRRASSRPSNAPASR